MQGHEGIWAREGGILMGGMENFMGGFASFLDRYEGIC